MGAILILFSSKTNAQQEVFFSQYMYSIQVFNPAYVGVEDKSNLTLLYRNQWIGVEGAPVNYGFLGNSRVGKNMGLGLNVQLNQVGPINNYNFLISTAYKLQIAKEIHLSMGLNAGLQHLGVNFSKLNVYQQDDTDFPEFNSFAPQFGIGFYLQAKKWFLGLSSPNILQTTHTDKGSSSTVDNVMHLYGLGGYTIPLNASTNLRFSAVLRWVEGSPVTYDFQTDLNFKNKFILGAGYRFNSAISGIAGLKIAPEILLGYAYEVDTTPFANKHTGTHELFLRYTLDFSKKLNKDKREDPRYF